MNGSPGNVAILRGAACVLADVSPETFNVDPRAVAAMLTPLTRAVIAVDQFGVPAVAYGPRARSIHGTDEAVELASIVSGARTMARFIAGFFMNGGLR